MRLLMIDKQRHISGQGIVVLTLAKGLLEAGHQVSLACQPGSDLAARGARIGLTVYGFPMARIGAYLSVPRLRKLVRRQKFDCVHAHGARDHQLAAMATIGAGVKLIRTKHNLVPLHHPWSHWLYNLSTKIVAVSDAVADGLIRDGVKPAKITLVRNGIDVNHFTPAPRSPRLMREFGIAADTLVIGTAARLDSKSVDIGTLLRAYKLLPRGRQNSRLLLVGRGGERLRPLITELDISQQVILTGFRDNIADFLSLMDIYAQPNVMAALSTGIIEAMSMSLPVVATRTGGAPEIVVENETGLLCPTHNEEAMAAAINTLLESAQKRKEMGNKGRQRAVEMFDYRRMIAQMERIYRGESPIGNPYSRGISTNKSV